LSLRDSADTKGLFGNNTEAQINHQPRNLHMCNLACPLFSVECRLFKVFYLVHVTYFIPFYKTFCYGISLCNISNFHL